MKPNAEELAAAAGALRNASAMDVLSWGLQRFGQRLSIASSFSIEDCVVIDLAYSISPQVRIFALDTGRLPDETYETAERVRAKYEIDIEWYFPEQAAVETVVRTKGLYSFRDSLDDRHECCEIRKVKPLMRALSELDAWVTGLRRAQSETRTSIAEIEYDTSHGGLAKLNPIIAWSDAALRAYAHEQRLPVHPLHARGYPSIGCAPCPRAISHDEHPRAGRWWWERPDSKECGLHLAK